MRHPFIDLSIFHQQQSFIGDLLNRKKHNNCTTIKEKCLAGYDFEVKEIIRLLSLQNEVQAITLGGSRSTGRADDSSDYDVYVYLKKELDNTVRKKILSPYCQYMEIGNFYWENEDNCILNNGIYIDIIYRNLNNFIHNIAGVVEKGISNNGYTTCLWHNLVTSKIVYDKNDNLKKEIIRFSLPYPKHLKNNIIKRNMNLLTDSLVSYDKQIRKSVNRQDIVNIHNRITEFLNSYFDVLFALNEIKNPGEKYIVEICMENCQLLPGKFKENIELLFKYLSTDINKINSIIEEMIFELKCIIDTYFIGSRKTGK